MGITEKSRQITIIQGKKKGKKRKENIGKGGGKKKGRKVGKEGRKKK